VRRYDIQNFDYYFSYFFTALKLSEGYLAANALVGAPISEVRYGKLCPILEGIFFLNYKISIKL